jgi:outer membrane protein assembly factor BamB
MRMHWKCGLTLLTASAVGAAAFAVRGVDLRPSIPEAVSPPVRHSSLPASENSTRPHADDWPNLFGPAHDNSASTQVDVDWPESGPPELWRIPIGSGYSSPIIVADRAIVLHRLGDEEIVSCFNSAAGAPLWELRYPTSFVCGSHYTSGPYSTPASDGRCVVTLGAQGQLHCLDLESGDIIWRRDTTPEFGVPVDIFGAGHSPLIWRDTVILNIGGTTPDSGVVAFDLDDGAVRWRATEDGPAYATPAPATIHGRERVLVLTREGLVLLDPEDGRVLDEFPYSSSIPDAYNAVTPAVWKDLVLVSVFGEGSVCLQVTMDDRFTQVWSDKRTLTSQYNPILVADGCLFGLHALDKSFRCVDFATGELQWRWKSPLARSTHLIAGSHILLFGEFGELGAVDLNPESCTQRALTSGSLFDGERCFSAPALSRGRLYLRNEHEFLCLDLRP